MLQKKNAGKDCLQPPERYWQYEDQQTDNN